MPGVMARPPPPVQPVSPVSRKRETMPDRTGNRFRFHPKNPMPRAAARVPVMGHARRDEAWVAVHGGKKLMVPLTVPPAGRLTSGSGIEHAGITTNGKRLGSGPVHLTVTPVSE